MSKVFLEEFDMPREIEAAAHMFYEALRKSGYNSGSVDACPDLEETKVSLSVFLDGGGVDFTPTQLHEGRWRVIDWEDEP